MTSGVYAIFTSCQKSHHFDERRIFLSYSEAQTVKIGRSVARLKPSTDNAIFDCKVLSRNHAILWYEDGRFYVRDTKSSNGTFINDKRLSLGGEESAPTEIYSGDIIQFGVDIIENTKQVTYGCILAMVRLFHADGLEASSMRTSTDITDSSTTVLPLTTTNQTQATILNSQELFQLQLYIREAVHREHMLEQKLITLQSFLTATQEASENSWQALINEDRLLSRIEMLESQLQLFSKNADEDRLRDEVFTLYQEKHKYESTVKESLRRTLQEKTEAVQKLNDVERSLETTEEECARLRVQADSLHTALDEVQKNTQERLVQLADQLHTTEQRCSQSEEMQRLQTSNRVSSVFELNDHSRLTRRIVRLEADLQKELDEKAEIRPEMDKLTVEFDRKLANDLRGGEMEEKVNEDMDEIRAKLRNMTDELIVERMKVGEWQLKTDDFRRRLEEASDLEEMAGRVRTVLTVSAIPLFILLLAILVGHLPFFSAFTGTHDPSDYDRYQ